MSKLVSSLNSIVVLFFYLCSVGLSKPTVQTETTALNFARNSSQLFSPDRVYVIENLVASPNRGIDLLYVEEPDKLFFKKATSSDRILIWNYHRNMDVFWAPDSKSFVLNDWNRNNLCDSYLYEVNAPNKPLSLRERLIHSSIALEDKELMRNKEYNYVFVAQWDSSKKLVIKAAGHFFTPGKTVSYTRYYSFDLKSNKWQLLKKEEVENLERKISNLSTFGA